MTKEMYTPPEAVVVEFGQEDIVCGTVSGTVEQPGTGDGDWGNMD
mgnify:CR=1 FL=1